MTLIDFECWRGRRRQRRAGGQMAALSYIREEIKAAGFHIAADLIGLAVASIADETRAPFQASNDAY